MFNHQDLGALLYFDGCAAHVNQHDMRGQTYVVAYNPKGALFSQPIGRMQSNPVDLERRVKQHSERCCTVR